MNAIVPVSPPSASQSGFKVLLYGATGTGKTYSIRTLLDAGLEVFVLFTEPGMATLRDVKSDKLHWYYVPPAPFNLGAFQSMLTSINTMPFQALAAMSDPNRKAYDQMLHISTALAKFTDQNGKTFESLDQWGTDRVFVVDSLSGIAVAAMSLVIGGRPVAGQQDWQVAMNTMEKFINMLCFGVRANLVMMAHEEREVNEVTGGTAVMPSTLGRKLSPKIGRFFDDVLMTYQKDGKFQWASVFPNYELKSRHLPLRAGMEPSFVPLVQSWRSGA